jgi:hypothetical protein
VKLGLSRVHLDFLCFFELWRKCCVETLQCCAWEVRWDTHLRTNCLTANAIDGDKLDKRRGDPIQIKGSRKSHPDWHGNEGHHDHEAAHLADELVIRVYLSRQHV